MAITVNWPTKAVLIPQTDCTWVSGTFYTFDTDYFYDQIRALEASLEGLPFQRVMDHNPTYTVAGTEYARKVEVINNYTVEFEETSAPWSVQLEGSNNNLWDIGGGVLVQNWVQVIPTNAAGLIVGSGGSAPTVSEITADIDANSTQLAAIKERTDNLPDAPADVSDIPTAEENADATWYKTLP